MVIIGYLFELVDCGMVLATATCTHTPLSPRSLCCLLRLYCHVHFVRNKNTFCLNFQMTISHDKQNRQCEIRGISRRKKQQLILCQYFSSHRCHYLMVTKMVMITICHGSCGDSDDNIHKTEWTGTPGAHLGWLIIIVIVINA